MAGLAKLRLAQPASGDGALAYLSLAIEKTFGLYKIWDLLRKVRESFSTFWHQ